MRLCRAPVRSCSRSPTIALEAKDRFSRRTAKATDLAFSARRPSCSGTNCTMKELVEIKRPNHPLRRKRKPRCYHKQSKVSLVEPPEHLDDAVENAGLEDSISRVMVCVGGVGFLDEFRLVAVEQPLEDRAQRRADAPVQRSAWGGAPCCSDTADDLRGGGSAGAAPDGRDANAWSGLDVVCRLYRALAPLLRATCRRAKA